MRVACDRKSIYLDGVCHVYIDDEADPEKAIRVADNAEDPTLRAVQHDGNPAGQRKCRRPGPAPLAEIYRARLSRCAAARRPVKL